MRVRCHKMKYNFDLLWLWCPFNINTSIMICAFWNFIKRRSVQRCMATISRHEKYFGDIYIIYARGISCRHAYLSSLTFSKTTNRLSCAVINNRKYYILWRSSSGQKYNVNFSILVSITATKQPFLCMQYTRSVWKINIKNIFVWLAV